MFIFNLRILWINLLVKIYQQNIRIKMRFELVIILIAGFLMANIYTDDQRVSSLVDKLSKSNK